MTPINFLYGYLKPILFQTKELYRDWKFPELQRFHQAFFNKNAKPAILIFGDSVYERVSRFDQDKTTLGKMLTRKITKTHNPVLITRGAYHFGVFYQFIRLLNYSPNKPSLVIVPINLRSFSPQWDCNPAFQRCQDILKLEKIIRNYNENDITELYGVDQKISNDTYCNTEFSSTFSTINRVRDFISLISSSPNEDIGKFVRKKAIFTFHYLYNINTDNRKIKLLKDILSILVNKLNINVLLYITPINYQSGEKFLGRKFTQIVNDNIETLKNVIQEIFLFRDNSHILFNNYSTLFDSSYFFHDDEATEHLNEKGRKVLSELIYDSIIKSGSNIDG